MTEPSGATETTPSWVGGTLRASDADRDQVMQVLSTAYAEGRISSEEHDERSAAVLAAKTFDDLVPLTRDLVLTGYPAEGLPERGTEVEGRAYTVEAGAIQPTATDDSDHMVAVFGGVTRKGKWRIKRHTQSFAMFGGIDLDLNEAVFESPVVEISGAWIFAGLDIKVPEGIEVRDETVGIFGGTDVKNVGEPQPGAPVLVVKGLALFAGVSVSGPKKRRRWH